MRDSLDSYFMAIAHAVARRSTCLDKQVGCVLVNRDRHILATGYNGPPSGHEHCTTCRKSQGHECPAVHAELNAVLQYSKYSIMDKDIVAYCTLSPCADCLTHLYRAGVTHVVCSTLSNKTPDLSYSPIAIDVRPELKPWHASIRDYHLRLGIPKQGCSYDTRIRQHRELMLAVFMEVAELTDSAQWKPWRGSRPLDADNFLEEASDILVFLDSLLMNWGFTWEDLFQALGKTLEKVNERLINGYHTKTEGQEQ